MKLISYVGCICHCVECLLDFLCTLFLVQHLTSTMSDTIQVQDIEPSVWNTVASFLYPYEQCKILTLCVYFKSLTAKGLMQIPQHNFAQDLAYWKDNFHPYSEFGFADINVKDKLTILTLDNGTFGGIEPEQRLQLLYYLKYHSTLASIYQDRVEELLNNDLDDYAGEFYKEMKFLFSLNIGDNNDAKTMEYVTKYIGLMSNESNEVKAKKCVLLKEICLNGNDLNDESVLLFCETVQKRLKYWKNLRKLELSDNTDITDQYMKVLIEDVIIEKCDGLDYLNLESTSIGDQTIDLIYEICEKYPEKIWIKHLNVQFNDNISDKAEDKLTNDAFKERFPMIAKGMKISI
eukprot:552274_1